jgi:tetratricopeptide (TPR) repeat protein
MSAYETVGLADIPLTGRNWQAIRRQLGVAAFGINAWRGDEEGADVIPAHDEVPTGHEELYLVLEGRATFTVGDDTVDGPAGTIVFVRDPAVQRGAVAVEPGTCVLTVGAKAGEAYSPRPWELNAEGFPLFDAGEYGRAKELFADGLETYGENGTLLYNLACAEARLGESDAALEHLGRAVELEDRFAGFAQDDEDLASLRDDPRFPSPAGATS